MTEYLLSFSIIPGNMTLVVVALLHIVKLFPNRSDNNDIYPHEA